MPSEPVGPSKKASRVVPAQPFTVTPPAPDKTVKAEAVTPQRPKEPKVPTIKSAFSGLPPSWTAEVADNDGKKHAEGAQPASPPKEKVSKGKATTEPLAHWVPVVLPPNPADEIRSDPIAPKPVLPDTPEPSPKPGYGENLAEDEKIGVRQDGTFVKDGVRYIPLPLAAVVAQTTEKNLRDWIKKDKKFKGQSIRTHRLSLTRKLYVSEESLHRMAERFVKWRSNEPSGEPAGTVIIGKTKDQTGFITMPEAAQIIGVSARTMWLWVKEEKAPIKDLDVIRCTTSDHFYIREKNVSELKKLVPRSGLQRGRRPQIAFQPG